MSDPFYPYYSGGFPAGDGGPPRPRYSDFEVDLIAARYSGAPARPYPSTADVGAFDSYLGAFDAHVGSRRSAEVLYHQYSMGSHSTFGQIEALYSSNTMAKRPRFESSFPIYPQRPGAKDCAFYMRTRTCKFGEDCKFDHPQWVPVGGIPNWKEVPQMEDPYPERPGEPDCPYFMMSSTCKFKSKCKFNHPKNKLNELEAGTGNELSLFADNTVLPVRPSEPLCSFYAKTGKCRFGANCKFNHPKDIDIPSVNGKETIYTSTIDAAVHNDASDGSVPAKTLPTAPAESHNSKGLPIRPGEVDCTFYMKTGSCKFGSTCCFNHPDRPVVDIALMSPSVPNILPISTPDAPVAVLHPAVNFLQSFGFHAAHAQVEPEPIIYPQRPGEIVCDFYMKTGYCKYYVKCKFHHPVNRSAPGVNEDGDPQQVVALTLAGLPRREDAEVCAFYMKSGTCRYGAHCKFDHPPPQEVIAKLQAAGKEGEKKSSPPPGEGVEMKAEKEGEKKKKEGLSIILR